jgi:mRNA-degrading endonuclease RelE of RelBE toxin-antitoxin system
VSDDADDYDLRVTGHAQRQLGRLPEGTAAAIIEFMLSALVENPHRVGGRLQREFAGFYSVRRGAYRVVYEIDDDQHAVIVLRIDHRSSVYHTLKSE